MKKSTFLTIGVPVGVFVILFFGIYTVWHLRPLSYHGTYLDPGLEVPDFELTSASGPVSKLDFRGTLTVLMFGYTTCPDVCPTTVSRVSRAINLLGRKARDVSVVLVTVDPERDTPEELARYLSAFDSTFVGLSGTPEEIADMASDYDIYYAKSEADSTGGYLVDHSTRIIVLDRDGLMRILWSFGTQPEQMASDMRNLIRT